MADVAEQILRDQLLNVQEELDQLQASYDVLSQERDALNTGNQELHGNIKQAQQVKVRLCNFEIA